MNHVSLAVVLVLKVSITVMSVITVEDSIEKIILKETVLQKNRRKVTIILMKVEVKKHSDLAMKHVENVLKEEVNQNIIVSTVMKAMSLYQLSHLIVFPYLQNLINTT